MAHPPASSRPSAPPRTSPRIQYTHSSGSRAVRHDGAGGARRSRPDGDERMAVDPAAIHPGYDVYAHHVDPANHADLGQFVGEVEAVLERRGLHYVQVGGGLQGANQLYLPIDG